MAVIPIAASSFSVITALLSTLSELATYRALRRVLAIAQCQVLCKSNASCIRTQRRRLKTIAWGSLAVFVLLETVLSIFNDPVTIPQNIVEDCLQLVAIPFAEDTLHAGERGDEARILCRRTDLADGFLVKELGANITNAEAAAESERNVWCDEREVYGYIPQQQLNRDVRNDTAVCIGKTCVFVLMDGQDLYMSPRPTSEERSREENKTWFGFLKTQVNFEVSDKLRQKVGIRLARALQSGERDEERLRAQTLLGTRKGQCVRQDESARGRDATKVETSVLIVACVIWVVALGALVVTESPWMRRMEFFDMGCEVQWAQRSFAESVDEAGEGEAKLRGVVVDGERCVMVVREQRS
ncbi:hypothetical protein BWQ96_07585 [Gracilariopsis chorda]|uniref:Uncharacterized protein n=1 Tax=Gracilariopsis chorda TaxID=448386 RepID=A0A2V3IKX7_9FLOR|nr:hypothetical protein BWQ96_07585 [Gracilariopsis chorda]|eukprot:PXF42699.1 hypothetical protein BWQ96_07585 [Gracilariopsis chorda]